MPRQMTAPHDERFIPKPTATGGAPADPLDHPDPLRAADSAGAENLLRCWVRETGPAGPDGPTLRIPLPASGTALLVPVLYWSATGWHRFGPPVLEGAPEGAPPADAVTIAALLGREAGRDEGADMVARVADSVRRTAGFIAERRRAPTPRPKRTSSSPRNSRCCSAIRNTPPPRAARGSPTPNRASTLPSRTAPSR